MTVVAALLTGAAATASWSAPGSGPDQGLIGIKLLDAPVSRQDDPRARMYIVDHLAPGTVIHRRVEVWNSTGDPKSFQVYAAAADIRGAQFSFADGRTGNDLSDWIAVDRTALDLPAHGTAPVEVTITVPAKASQGERYAVVWAQVAANAGPSGNIGMISRTGVRVYLDIGPGGEPPSDFTIDKVTPGRTPDGRPTLVAHVHNTGGRAVDIGGSVTLSDGPGSLSAGPFEVPTGTTLRPGASADVLVPLDKRLPAGPWRVQLTLASGTVRKIVTVVVTFPETAGLGAAVVPEANWVGYALVGGAVVLAVAVLVLTALRLRRRRVKT